MDSRVHVSKLQGIAAKGVALVIGGSLIASGAQAQPGSEERVRSGANLETLLVIGKRTEESRTDLAGSLDLITREELAYERVDDTVELFAKVPGAYLSRFNQGVINADVAIRGFAADGSTPHAKLLIDGVPANRHNGWGELDQLFPTGIGSMRVFKGTSDPRYGLYNLAGNYEVQSRSEVGITEIEGSLGSFDAREIHAYSGLEHGALTHNYAIGYREASGYRDHTDIEKYSLSGRWFYALTEATELGLIVRHSAFEADAPGFLSREEARQAPRSSAAYANQDGGEKRADHASLHLDMRPGAALELAVKLYFQDFERERWVRFSAASALQHRFDDESQWGVINHLEWRPGDIWTVRAGLDFEHQDVIEQRFGTLGQSRLRNPAAVLRDFDYRFDALGAFVQLEQTPSDLLRWNVGVRVDRLDGEFSQRGANGVVSRREMHDFGWVLQPKLNLFVNPAPNWTLFANYGRSFQHPFGSAAYTAGDRRSRDVSLNDGWETGLLYAPGSIEVRLSAWRQDASDEFVAVDGTPRNVGETRRQGIDLGWRWAVNQRLDIWGNYSRLDTEIVDAGDAGFTGNALRSIPEYTASLGLNWQLLHNITARMHVDSQGDYYINEANLGGRYGGYTLVGLGLTYVAAWGSMGVDFNNVFDRYHEYVFDNGTASVDSIHSPGDGRSVSMSVSWWL